ncbi:hypothetical protein [Pelagicoccus sp. SDUM812003]|uniref:hypothetical protein n=1 Tax=Pelagicoccus sp. SDUM812003 TaxID=3041267 RepID=UPI00280CE175|nr:hypothetical protein [Pelagicoccus sp. SDUM812003]MDQ8205806.1 hypothetical protein [Pelagicoccus sp. SDUM812003]
MKLTCFSVIVILALPLLSKADTQLHYARKLTPETWFTVIILPDQITTHFGEDTGFGKQDKIEKEEFTRLAEVAKKWMITKIDQEDFTREGKIEENNVGFTIFSGTSIYTVDWNKEKDGMPEFEKLLFEILEVDDISELKKEEPNQAAHTTPASAPR